MSDGLRVCRDVSLDAIPDFHPEEAAGGVTWRWTDSDLPLAADLWAGWAGLAILTPAFDPTTNRAWIGPERKRFRVAA